MNVAAPAPADVRQTAQNLALHAFGTAWIFERRARKYAGRLRVLAFLGLSVPLVVGALVIAFGVKFAGLEIVLIVGGILAVGQVVWSLWALVAKWDDAVYVSWQSQSANTSLCKRFQDLAESDGAVDPGEIHQRMQLLRAENDAQENQDLRREITDTEKRLGMRAGLKQFQRRCAGCNQIPVTLKSAKCAGGICGTP